MTGSGSSSRDRWSGRFSTRRRDHFERRSTGWATVEPVQLSTLESSYSIYIESTIEVDVDGTHHLRRVSGREFNRQPSAIKRQVQEGSGPVVITDHGHPVAVLMSWSDYSRTHPVSAPLTELLAHPASADVELPLERDSTPHGPVPL